MTATDSVRFCDTALRDRQQAARLAFSLDDGVDIALALDTVGVEQVAAELGPAEGGR